MYLCKKKPKETTLELVLQMPEKVTVSLSAQPQQHHTLFLMQAWEGGLWGPRGLLLGSPAYVLASEGL